MPDHEPFDGKVPWVVRVSPEAHLFPWVAVSRDNRRVHRFATWREAMDYAMGESDD